MTRFPRAVLYACAVALAALSLLFLTACPPSVDTTPEQTPNGGDTTTPPAATVAAPTASVAAGPVAISQQLSLSSTTDGATIRYTTDGSDPTETSTVFTVTTPIELLTATTVKAKAFKDGLTSSDVSSFAYTIGNGFTVSWNGTRRSSLQAEAGSVELLGAMKEIFPLIDYACDRGVLALAVRDSAILGDPPQFMLLLGADYSSDAGNWMSIVQCLAPAAGFDTAISGGAFPVTIPGAQPASIIYDGLFMSDGSITSTELIIDSYSDQSKEISGRFSCVGTMGDGPGAITSFTVSSRFKALLVYNAPRNLGSAADPFFIPLGGAAGMSANGGTSHYRIGARAGINHFIIKAGLDLLFYPDYGPAGLRDQITIYRGIQEVVETRSCSVWSDDAIQAEDIDFSITHSGVNGLGASYIVCHQIYPTFTTIAPYDTNGDGSLEDEVSRGSAGSVGRDLDQDYTTDDVLQMLFGFSLGFSYDRVTYIVYGQLDADPSKVIFAVRLDDNSWAGAEISLEALSIINSRDPFINL